MRLALSFGPVGPLSYAETLKLVWALPALDRLDEREIERVWRMVGGHPRSLEYLDALLSGGRARYPDVSIRLANAVKSRSGLRDLDSWFATISDLDAALAETLTLAAADVLLDELLNRLGETPGAERLLLGASVYREPVDFNALLYQVGDPDDDAAYTPHRRGADEEIRRLLTAAGINLEDRDEPLDLATLPDALRRALAPHLRELELTPTPPRSTSSNLAELVAACEDSSLLAVDPTGEAPTVFVHRWTATELAQRWVGSGRQDEVTAAHRRAAEYWRWRVAVWPQDWRADMHDRLEARYHLLETGDVELAAELTEAVCSQLHTWGAWDDEVSLIHDTLTQLPAISKRRAGLIHQLGILASQRGDYGEAERLYRQALEIKGVLGDGEGVALTLSQIGALLTEKGDIENAILYNLRSLAIRLDIGSPDAQIDFHWLQRQHELLEDDRFDELLHGQLDEASVANLKRHLSQVVASDPELRQHLSHEEDAAQREQ